MLPNAIAKDKVGNTTDLFLSKNVPISFMALLSNSSYQANQPGAQNNSAGFPQQLSIFLAGGFAATGLTLFSDPSGNVPSTASGFASVITVNPKVVATPSLVRDGTQASPLNPTGATGFTGVISAVVTSAATAPGGTLATAATNVTANQAALSSNAQTASTAAASLSTALTNQASSTSGVSIDQQMGLLVTLQNAYAANAKVVNIAQQMWAAQEAMIS
ncbi:MAG: hypothetical protein B7X01_04170 [Acidiphilium sp. 21-62-4]|nr:MAG: hypothetical protein B7X01_04170 [Acidiphilium sp. 21-62-4]